MDLGLSGLASGLDWRTLVDQLSEAERAPANRLRVEQNTLQQQKNAFSGITTQIKILQGRVQTLMDPTLFDSRLAISSNVSTGSATAATGAAAGAYTFQFKQLATISKQLGSAGVGNSLSSSSDVSSLVLSQASFPSSISAGTFTVNGRQVTIATSDTLQQVFDKISGATGGAVTASYDAASDRIALQSAASIVLGSATDSSNFLQAARLQNNGTGTVTSATALGAIRMDASLGAANFATPVSYVDGAGEFKINGVAIRYTSEDKVSDLLNRINESGAGVTAVYDSLENRFSLVNRTTGDLGVALEDVTGNFLEASGLSDGVLERGRNLTYTVNGGPDRSSQSNTVTEATSGIAGLSVTASAEGSTVVTVSSDVEKIRQAINDFISDYNKVQSVIDSQTASTTDANGQVTAGVLANDGDASDLASQLRRSVADLVPGLGAALNQLEDLGVVSNGNDNSLTLEDGARLDAALAGNLSGVKALFAGSDNGIAVRLNKFLERVAGEDGSLAGKQDRLARASADIDTQIAGMERLIQDNRQRLIDSFIAMETVQARINQQLQFLQQRFGAASGTAAG